MKKKSTTTRKLVIIPIVYVLLILLYSLLIGFPSHYTLKNKYTITCESDTQIRLFQFIPTSYGYQTVNNRNVSPDDHYSITDNGQLSILRMERSLPKGTTDIQIDYDVRLKKGKVTWGDNDSSTSQHLNPAHSELADVAANITDGASTEDAIRIHKFVVDHMAWDYSTKINQKQKSGIELYNQPSGVCVDFAILMTALLNSHDIPARVISGHSMPLLFNSNKISEWGHQAGAHAWVEFYTDDTWHVSDPSWGKSHANLSDGRHLSYGDSLAFDQIYDQEMQWMQDGFKINAAMSQPLMFGIASSDSNLKVVPMGSVQIHYDKLLLYLIPLGAYIIVTIIVLIINKTRKHNRR